MSVNAVVDRDDDPLPARGPVEIHLDRGPLAMHGRKVVAEAVAPGARGDQPRDGDPRHAPAPQLDPDVVGNAHLPDRRQGHANIGVQGRHLLGHREAHHEFVALDHELRDRVSIRVMNGAQALVKTLAGSGVNVSFANPGTSEMHFVAALDTSPDMRGVLCLFEGVVTGAADGYGRMTGRPASTLLHLGPGLGNGLANLHNARRARTPVVNVIGDHATYHKRVDAPLESDIDALANSVSRWVRRSSRPEDVGPDAADAVAAACSGGGGVASLILPADVSWGKGGTVVAACPARPLPRVAAEVIADAADALTGDEPAVLLLGGRALRQPALAAAARIAAAVAPGC